MPSDKSKEYDGLLDDEDFDMDDESFSDEAWDEFDDDIAEDLTPDDLGEGDESLVASSDTKDKTFVQKHFNAIVLTVTALGGSAFFLMSMGKPSENAEAPYAAEASAESFVEGGIAEPDESAAQNIALLPEPVLLDEVPLEPENLREEETLEALPFPDFAAPEPIKFEQEEILGELELLDNNILTPMPFPSSSDNMADMVGLEAVADNAPDISSEEVASEPSLDDIFAPPPVLSPLDSIPQPQVQAHSGAQEEISALAEKLEKSKIEFQQNINQKKQIITQRDETIKELTGSVSSLEAQISALKGKVSVLENSKTKAAKSANHAPESVQKVAAKPVLKERNIKHPAKKSPPVKWLMRSASPGKATVSAQGSSDLIRVEVGSYLPSLGTVTFIGLENGRWIVKATDGELVN